MIYTDTIIRESMKKEGGTMTNEEEKAYEEGYETAISKISKIMCKKAFYEDNGMARWDSGLWIRYKLFEDALEEMKNYDE